MKTNKELLIKNNDHELWGSKYSFESWVTAVPIEDTRTGKIYKAGSLIFALISYIDDNNKVQFVDETQYFKLLED